MEKQLQQLREFHRLFKVPVHKKPIIPATDRIELRTKLMQEELQETHDAALAGDVIGVADGLADQLYVLIGTIHEYGMGHVITKVFDEVHRSNMSKVFQDGTVQYREDGKVLKPPTYSPANLAEVLKKYL